jgi:hypothetical protein
MRNADAQVQLIDDLLDVSRIIAGKMRLDVRPVVAQGIDRRAREERHEAEVHAVLGAEALAVAFAQGEELVAGDLVERGQDRGRALRVAGGPEPALIKMRRHNAAIGINMRDHCDFCGLSLKALTVLEVLGFPEADEAPLDAEMSGHCPLFEAQDSLGAARSRLVPPVLRPVLGRRTTR